MAQSFIKLMSGENLPDTNPNKEFTIINVNEDITGIKFSQLPTPNVVVGDKYYALEGNAYVMNQNGKTVATFTPKPELVIKVGEIISSVATYMQENAEKGLNASQTDYLENAKKEFFINGNDTVGLLLFVLADFIFVKTNDNRVFVTKEFNIQYETAINEVFKPWKLDVDKGKTKEWLVDVNTVLEWHEGRIPSFLRGAASIWFENLAELEGIEFIEILGENAVGLVDGHISSNIGQTDRIDIGNREVVPFLEYLSEETLYIKHNGNGYLYLMDYNRVLPNQFVYGKITEKFG